MPEIDNLEDRIANHYSDLSVKLKVAADFLAQHPVDVATRSLRALSAASGVSPATFSRLARAIGYDTYEAMREVTRKQVGRQAGPLSERAGQLQAETASPPSILERQAAACVSNIAALHENTDPARLNLVAARLRQAQRVVLFGALSSTGITEYMSYLANFFTETWTLAGRMGASLGAVLSTIGKGDVLLIVTKTPYAGRAVISARTAREKGAFVIVVTDSHSCPASKYCDVSLIVPSDSPQFFSSYAATIVLLESIIAAIVAQSGPQTQARIAEVEARNGELGEFWSG